VVPRQPTSFSKPPTAICRPQASSTTDQLGSAYSDQPDEPSLWEIPRFVSEVEQVRLALGLDTENFLLLGHSWGGALAMEYAFAHQQHLKGLVSGKLERWDRSDDLGRITVPTLVIGARYDTMDPGHMAGMAEKLPDGRYLFCPNGSHMATYDDQATYFAGIIDFINDVDATSGGRR
jgi:pimeloyl-ACP methyl ester carboxylesterase